MKKETTKGKMEVALKTPETVNPFQMMRRFTKNMERLFEDFQGFGFPTFFKTDFPPFRMEFDNVQWVPQIEVLHNEGQFMVRARGSQGPGLLVPQADRGSLLVHQTT